MRDGTKLEKSYRQIFFVACIAVSCAFALINTGVRGKIKEVKRSFEERRKEQFEKLYQHFMSCPLPPKQGSLYFEAFWKRYDGLPLRHIKTSMAHACWKTGNDRRGLNPKS